MSRAAPVLTRSRLAEMNRASGAGAFVDLAPDERDALAAIVQRHGADEATRAQAAAHESGHILAFAALGRRTVVGVSIWPEQHAGRRTWCGLTDAPANDGSARITARENPQAVFAVAVEQLSGYVGECATDLDHPSSSLDERVIASRCCATLAMALPGTPPERIAADVEAFCLRALERNRVAFDVLRSTLDQRRRLRAPDLRRLLARVEPAGAADYPAYLRAGVHA